MASGLAAALDLVFPTSVGSLYPSPLDICTGYDGAGSGQVDCHVPVRWWVVIFDSGATQGGSCSSHWDPAEASEGLIKCQLGCGQTATQSEAGTQSSRDESLKGARLEPRLKKGVKRELVSIGRRTSTVKTTTIATTTFNTAKRC